MPFNVESGAHQPTLLARADRFVHTLDPDERFDTTVLLDCAEPGRAGDRFPSHGWAETILVLDHHLTWDPDFATHYVRDSDARRGG